MEPLDHLQPLFCGGTTLAKNYILGFHVPQRTQYSPLGVDVPCLPLTFCLLPPYVLAMYIALFPFINPTTCETEYLGGIDKSM
jgi:hypothetical protein